jgi:hypothetical protein
MDVHRRLRKEDLTQGEVQKAVTHAEVKCSSGDQPSSLDMSLSLSSGMMSSSLDTFEMKSSSESMVPSATVVTGVGGALSGPAEARILLFGAVPAEDIVASAAFRLRVAGGMVPAYASAT